jgi:leucyl aminopeptidase
MKISFAATRPAGDYALVIPSSGGQRPALKALGSASAAVEAAIKRQRFEGDASSVVEQFLDGGQPQRLLVIGTGAGIAPAAAAEKLGGAAAARLLLSGETHAVIDLTGLDYDADSAARVALAAALRSFRYDRYKTRLKDKQKPTLA